MTGRFFVASAVCVALVSQVGCGLRRTKQSTNVATSVVLNQNGESMQALARDEYEVLGTGEGKDNTVGVFILWFPAGNQKSNAELNDSAYFSAVDSHAGCDAMRMGRAKTRRVVIPLLLVNIIIKSVRVKGRCIRMRSLEEINADNASPASAQPAPPVPPTDREAGPVQPVAPSEPTELRDEEVSPPPADTSVEPTPTTPAADNPAAE